MNEEKKQKTPQQHYIDEAARAGAREVLHIQRTRMKINFYRATEDSLRAYAKIRRMIEDGADYGFFPTGKSHDISVAPPPGLGLRDAVELNELFVEARKRSFTRTVERFEDIDLAVRAHEHRREFVVIRMYYFNEDEYGNDRGVDAKRYTWEEIAEALEHIGIYRSVSVLRGWRSSLVRDMCVMIYGVDGAAGINSGDHNPQNNKGEGETHDSERYDA